MDPQKISLLIGSEDPASVVQMQEQLQGFGYHVDIQASAPDEVVTLATKLHPDLMILDLHIGGDTHGVEVARDIRDVITIPTVFLSRFPDDVSKTAHAVPKPCRYVTKPVGIAELHSAIQDLLP